MGSCLVISLCILTGIGYLLFSGILSGGHGNTDTLPAWSPDGSQIVFMSNRDGNFDIYVMNVDGSHVRQLTRDAFGALYFIKSAADITPTWSPDGERIAFASGRNNGMMTFMDTDIYLMDPDGSHVVRIPNDLYTDAFPAWSPDGKKIAFIGMPAPRDDITDILVMDVDSHQITKVKEDLAVATPAVWSPDSRNINFVYENKLYTMNISDGSTTDVI
jgi:Tol biopolymer transport system component